MKNTKKLLIGNWKMNPETLEEAKKIFSGIKKAAAGAKMAEVVICPPSLYLPSLSKLTGGVVEVGGQDCYFEKGGAFTGFISPIQLKNAGANYCIVGHSERRMRGESNKDVNLKLHAVLDAGLIAVLCVGESERNQSGAFLEFIKNQLKESLEGVKKAFLKNIVIAYEPVWAIGASEAMNPRDLHQMTLFIRKVLVSLFPQSEEKVPVLYGGAVDSGNCEAILFEGEAQGLLAGRASLDPKVFGEIIRIAGGSRSQ